MNTTRLTNEQLISKCKTHDELAYMEIYDRYYKAMYNTSLRIIRDAAEAEDIVQEAFLTSFTKIASLKDNKAYGAWLKQIVVNDSISVLNRTKKFPKVPMEIVTHRLEDQDIVVETISDIKATVVLNKLADLKESYRTILTLHFIEGYDYGEICEILKISAANCRTLISRAKEKLRKELI